MKKSILLIALLSLASLQIFAQIGLKSGDQAPEFTAKDNGGKTLDLKALLKTHKAVVLFFYRGQWCPYCNKQMAHLQDSLQFLTAKGAYVIGVTPETDENINKTVDKTHASFSLVHDKDYKIMKDYKVNYVMDEGLYANYKKRGLDMEQNNGNTDHVLPVPATYVIDQSGKLIFAHFDKDYTKRPSVKSILSVL